MNTLNTYNKKEAVALMNAFGKARNPFFFAIDFEMEKIVIESLDSIHPFIHFNFNGVSIETKVTNALPSSISFNKYPIHIEAYQKMFDKVISEIKYGNSFLVNLTSSSTILSNLSLSDIYQLSEAKYKLLLEDQFVCYSPECFIKINQNIISTYPMKGTISTDIPNAENELLNDLKENAEHCTIVDLLRNDLSMIAKNVRLNKFKYLDKITTREKSIFQMSSEIIGEMDPNYHTSLGDIMFTLLPAGSVSGAPKSKTLEIIRSAEGQKRGYYSGISGIYDGNNLDSGVMIRYVESRNGILQYRSGGGLTLHERCRKRIQRTSR